MKKAIILSIALLLASGGGNTHADFIFGTPINLGPTINSPYEDAGQTISVDGLSLYFSSNRPGGSGDYDIWVTNRSTTRDDWETPTNLGPVVNSTSMETSPCLSADGLSLFFSDGVWHLNKPRPGGLGKCDIWLTTRPEKDDNWGTPVNPGAAVNTSAHECDPSISANGLSLFFDSDRSGGRGSVDLWVTTRATKDVGWSNAENLGPSVNSAAVDAFPSISSDGLCLFFMSDRTGDYDLWMTRRATIYDPWETAINLGPAVNSSDVDACPTIAADSSTLFFMSMRPGGIGGYRDLWLVSIEPVFDLNSDKNIDFRDLSKLVQDWLHNEPSVDIAPPLGDGIVNFRDMAVLAGNWVEEILYIKWFAHASVKVWTEDAVVYVDPRNLSESPHDATLVLVTHTHGDHYQPASISRVSNSQTKFIAPPDVVQQYGQGQAIAPGQTIISSGVPVTGVASYNTNKTNHPKSRNWVGYIIELGSKRVYVAGDTDLIPEMQTLGEIDVAILPAGGTYTMNATEAAEAATIINPTLAIPYHWGTSVGTLADAQTFAQLARCAVKIMAAGETIGSDNWPEYSPLIAHWTLDETEGSVAQDSAGDNDGTLHGNPAWQPASGKIDGALQFNGADNYVSTPSVLDPADGAFSVFAWVKGGAAGQVIISQTDGTGTGATWLGAEQSQGKLMTGLVPPRAGRFVTPPLVSEFVITDGQWYHIGFVWDGSLRHLYVDGTEVARDAATLAPLISSDGDLYIGAGKDRDAASFFAGLIDDVRIYNLALSTGEIEELVR